MKEDFSSVFFIIVFEDSVSGIIHVADLRLGLII
jgi:hypothetical protein